jgi:hypothetical protein
MKSQENSEKVLARNNKTIFKNLIKKPTALASAFAKTESTNKDESQFLMLNLINKGCSELIKSAKGVVDNQSGTGEDKFSLYKMEFATSITCSYFIELTKALELSVAIIDAEKTSDNLLKQYNVFYTMNTMNAAMIALNAMNIPLSAVLYETPDFERFMRVFENTVEKIISNTYDVNIHAHSPDNIEMDTLWSEIEDISKNIMSFSLDLIYNSLEDVIKKLIVAIDEMEKSGKEDLQLTYFLKYISIPETMGKLLREEETRTKVLHVYDSLAKRQVVS